MLNKDSKYFKKKYFFLNPLKYKKISVPIKIEVITLEVFNEQKIKIVDLLKIKFFYEKIFSFNLLFILF